jgi:putative membrane protein
MKLSKKSIPYRAARDLGVMGVAVLFTGGGGSLSGPNLIITALLASLFVFSYIVLLGWKYFVWKNYDYFLEDGKFKFSKGVLRKTEREIPLRRIQNVDVNRNIVHRVIGLAKLELETAGGSSTEASLKYVSPEQAEEIRVHVKQEKKASEDEEEEKEEGEPVYNLSDSKLVIFSGTNLDFATIIGIFAVMGFFLTGLGAAVEEFGIAASFVISVLAVGALFVALGTNFVKNFEKYYGFRLWKNKDHLRYERGLLNRQEGTIPLDKIQDLKLEENFLKRSLGFATLKIETAGYSGEKASKKGAEAAIPLDRRENVVEFAEELESFEMPGINPIAAKSRRRYLGRYSIALGVLPVAGFFTGQMIPAAMLYFLIFPFVGVASHLKYRNRGYATAEKHFFTMKGFWNRKTMIVPYYRVQNLLKSQTVFQKRFNLSSLTVDIAGTGMISGDPVIYDLESENTEKVEEEIYSLFRESLRNHSSM